MKTTKRIAATLITTLATAAPALAAGTREDTSGIYVWVFLGFCALIVAAQIVPAALMVVGAAKGVAEGIRERTHATVRDG